MKGCDVMASHLVLMIEVSSASDPKVDKRNLVCDAIGTCLLRVSGMFIPIQTQVGKL